jgi:hypothetical protein
VSTVTTIDEDGALSDPEYAEPDAAAVAAATLASLHGKLLLRVLSTIDTHILLPRLPS